MNISQRLKDVAISDSGFLFDPVTGLTFSVNPTGRFILERLRDGLAADGVVDALKDAFDVNDRDDLTRDLKEFVRLLREQGILSRDAEV
ncbi:MAG: PqqD family protein [Deltaproteobacteria bacterium]|nr:PqqD family protein [Deltaproteobacteria bacterium]